MKPKNGSIEAKPNIKLVKALQKDFKALYQPKYTVNHKTKQMLINIELGIMRLDNLEKYITSEISTHVASALKEIELPKESEPLKNGLRFNNIDKDAGWNACLKEVQTIIAKVKEKYE